MSECVVRETLCYNQRMQEMYRRPNPTPAHVEAWRRASDDRTILVEKRWDGSLIYKSEQDFLRESWMHKRWRINLGGQSIEGELVLITIARKFADLKEYKAKRAFIDPDFQIKVDDGGAPIYIQSDIARFEMVDD